jgi:fumarate hydratase, class I
MAPLTMWDEKNTGTNLPAEIKISAVDGDAYKFLFMAKGGGSANKSYLFQETKAAAQPDRARVPRRQAAQLLGTSACPPYHLAVVIGGTSAEHALETAKLASPATSTRCPPRARRPATASATSRWRPRC